MDDPILVYDDECGFCTWWSAFFTNRSVIRRVGFSDLEDDMIRHLPTDYEGCAHLLADGRRYSCGAAMEEAFCRSVGRPVRPLVDVLRQFETYGDAREVAYRFVANNRMQFGKALSATPPAR